jgi:hypothetical protein
MFGVVLYWTFGVLFYPRVSWLKAKHLVLPSECSVVCFLSNVWYFSLNIWYFSANVRFCASCQTFSTFQWMFGPNECYGAFQWMFTVDFFSSLTDCAMFSKTTITFATNLEIVCATPFWKTIFETNVMVSIECLLGIWKSKISHLRLCFQCFLVL